VEVSVSSRWVCLGSFSGVSVVSVRYLLAFPMGKALKQPFAADDLNDGLFAKGGRKQTE